MDRGWSPRLKAFTQYEGADVLDAAVLLMPLVKFISPTDPKWLSTLDALTATLVSDSLVYHYDPQASPDGLRGAEGTFSACSFWYVEALTRAGRLEEARLAFEKMLTYEAPRRGPAPWRPSGHRSARPRGRGRGRRRTPATMSPCTSGP